MLCLCVCSNNAHAELQALAPAQFLVADHEVKLSGSLCRRLAPTRKASAVKFWKAQAIRHIVTPDLPQKGQGRMTLFYVVGFPLGIVE